jgi:hypothetical protein
MCGFEALLEVASSYEHTLNSHRLQLFSVCSRQPGDILLRYARKVTSIAYGNR